MELAGAKRSKALKKKENAVLKEGNEKMVGPPLKKAAVMHIVGKRICSVRRACRYVGMPRSTYDYLPKPAPPHQEQLHQRIVALSWAHPRYGYRRIRVLLGREAGR